MKEKALSTESYKGVRDFYPEDQFIQEYIFGVWKTVAESYGYEAYNASILESAELYKAKSGEEIVNEQTYTFTDRGDRAVTLRPEMTPTIARMIAAKIKELTLPIRWYSMPNLFRYEQPQKGRLREHWQLNVDIFGVETRIAEIEILSLSYSLMHAFGAQNNDFVIYINNRKIINDIYALYELSLDEQYKVSKIIDKKNKIPKTTFEDSLKDIMGDKADDFIRTISSTEKIIEKLGSENEGVQKIISLIEECTELGIPNITFNPLLMRGFDYYTDIVFEVFDTDPENKRAMFGGGRYDDLLSIFGSQKVPAIGFGMGDVTIREFLQSHKLLPTYTAPIDIYICTAEGTSPIQVMSIANKLRTGGIRVTVDTSGKKIGDQIKKADKKKAPFVLCIGETEISTGMFELKEMAGRETRKVALEDIVPIIKK